MEKSQTSKQEEEILKFWQKERIFEKTLQKKPKKGDFVFYDGPPFATGLPHYGHILAGVIKDAIPRYKTMQGFKVPRRWGWDCHGLPIENLIEKDLGLKTKKDIEEFGIGKFNQKAKNSVFLYRDEWKKIIPRTGRWVDMENDYKTMDFKYTESVWWVFKTLYEKGLIYKGKKSMHICPRCETTLSNFEVNQGYKDIKDISIIVKFPAKGQKNTFVLAWTTTPWTLPANVALAVNKNAKYAKVKVSDQDGNSFYVILAKDRIPFALKDKEYKVVEEFAGKELVGMEYLPVFDYYAKDENLKNREKGWKIYDAEFVTLDSGVGIVHIAPAFGEDDMRLQEKYSLPFVQHVLMDGKIKKEVSDFFGEPVKPKGDHQSTDIKIIKWLSEKNFLFAKEKITHSYPHCWRCDTPLLNYATSSWFVAVEKIKDKILKNNKKINWIPEYIKEGRFGKWIQDAPDWSISRSRFWGAPLPVWVCENCGQMDVVGSVSELAKKSKLKNRYKIIRHGEALSNKNGIVDSSSDPKNKLTKKGEKQVKDVAKKIKNIDLIISSPFERTKQTAKIIAKELGISQKNVIFDDLLGEINTGIFDKKPEKEYHAFFYKKEPKTKKEFEEYLLRKFQKAPKGGENLLMLKRRLKKFLDKTEKQFEGKNILIVSHEYPLWMLESIFYGYDDKEAVRQKAKKKSAFIENAEVRNINAGKLPLDKDGYLDLHRPYIDKILFVCKNCNKKAKRIDEVFDCWFESGSMPYGQAHYPFENKKSFERNFPAEFIAEGLDQTRGWFYTLLVLSTALFSKPTYKNVVVNGIILAEDGQKMSKRLKNYPDPQDIIDKYGADSLRYYLLSSPAVHADALNFSEKGVDEVHKKIVMRLKNVLNFYQPYKNDLLKKPVKTKNVLDLWIQEELKNLNREVQKFMDKYELDKAVRPIEKFVEDLSLWYIRRSRVRFKKEGEDKKSAVFTTNVVLKELAKICAPFMPFLAEEIYLSVGKDKLSVHLEDFPKLSKKINQSLINEMKKTRDIVSDALQKRAEAKIKVRQPLAKLKIKSKIKKEFIDLIKEEVNVKEVEVDASLKENVVLDTNITEELKLEGMARDFIRSIQEERKAKKLTKDDKIKVIIKKSDLSLKIAEKFKDKIKEDTIAKSIEFGSLYDAKSVDLYEGKIFFQIVKLS